MAVLGGGRSGTPTPWRGGPLGRLLPHGLPLPASDWQRRHEALLIALWLLTGVAATWSMAAPHLDAVPIHVAVAIAVVIAGLASLTRRAASAHRELTSSALTFGLLWCAALVVRLSGGAIEAHFLFFVVVAAATLYQSWAPFLTTVAFVIAHDGIIGSLRPHSVYDHPGALDRPWLWTLLHASLIGLAAMVGIAAWKSDERIRLQFAKLAERNDTVLATVADGIAVIDRAGHVTQANPAAYALLGPDLLGRGLSELLRPGLAELPRDGFDGLLTAVAEGRALSRVQVQTRRDGRPVEISLRPVTGVGASSADDVRAVLSVRDMVQQRRAEHAERSLASARQREADQRRAATELAAAFRPTPLELPDAEIGVTYLPAQSAPAGGDSYDWSVLPDGGIQVVVVDAMGSGLPAMRQALAVTATVRTLTLADCPFPALLARTARLLERDDDELVATVLVARYWPHSGRVRLVGAGHPPALHLRPGGRAVEVEAPGVPVGYPGGGSDGVVDLVLEPGETLLLYTDGLIEGTRDVLQGLAALTDACTELALVPAQQLTDWLISDLSTCARYEDDCLAVAVRRPLGSPVAARGDSDEIAGNSQAEASGEVLTLAPEAASVPLARRFAVAQARGAGVPEPVCDTLALLVTEIMTNAVLHAKTPVTLTIEIGPDAVLARIVDGDRRLPRQRSSAEQATSGRGLALVEALSAAWGADEHADGKTVWFRLSRTEGARGVGVVAGDQVVTSESRSSPPGAPGLASAAPVSSL